MKMPRVDNFLGCMTLETGGLVIGWLSAIGYFFSFLFGGIFLIVISIFDCEKLSKAFKKNGGLDKIDGLDTFRGFDKVGGLDEEGVFDEDDMFICSFGRVFLIVFSALIILLSIGFIIISYFCIKGTHRRNHIHVKPMMILMAVLTVISFLDIFETSYTSLGTAIAETIISGYQFIVLYSLYNKFLDEFTNGPTAYFQAPIDKAYFQPTNEKAYFQPPNEKA